MRFSKAMIGLNALSLCSAAAITDDSYFYGQSPPVYPAPIANGTGDWADAYAKAVTMVNQMTLEEKVSLTSGVGSGTSCVGLIPAIPRLGFPGICVSDAGQGLRSEELVSSWPSGIHAGASWNRNLSNFRGQGMGGEYKAKGVNILLGPVIGPLGRTVLGGRMWEGFSVDPYLTGALAYETVKGIQSTGVGASIKHFIGNEQETHRKPETLNGQNVTSVSSNIGDKTMHEVYLWPFQDAVRAGGTNVMCSYQRTNNSYACQNSKMLNGLLKTELGFQGFVVTDWDAIHGGVASAEAGLDVAMPNDKGFWGQNLITAVNNGSVPLSRVDDMATRVIAQWYKLGQDATFKNPGSGMPADKNSPHTLTDARDPRFKSVLRQGAVEGHVLVKNEGVLPLTKPKMLSVFGFSARSPDLNNFGAVWSFGYAAYDYGGVTEAQAPSFYRPEAINGTLYSGGGSGATSQSLVISPMDALMQQAWEDDTGMFWDFSTNNPTVNGASDACIVMVNLYACEGFDRPSLQSSYSNTLIGNVASKCANTIVVVHNAGPMVIDPAWGDHPNVKAIVLAHLPGQYSGKALIDLLYGKENFSGKLPYTVAKKDEDYGPLLNPQGTEGGDYELFPQADFDEGIYIDYRHFDHENIEPRYEFGYGLSYSKFEYSNIQVQWTGSDHNLPLWPTKAVVEGGQEDLWDVVATVRADVKNTGTVDGAEVAQLYISNPDAINYNNSTNTLRGFDKQTIAAGQTVTFEFPLTRRDLSVWDLPVQNWLLLRGPYKVHVGASSRNLPLSADFTIG